ncbi:MAG TPA: hypothetical protein VK501_22070 [Baekduia sp.]|uniref:hypothetical protein n=1 Tax=Baekduia sp. TaxID=2600305 RepID=UPI002CE0DF7E|nr:hypothetical protein [Baekduia sp.]HMJ36607.1 hypothetical protein [Baekduia sp.]
MRRPLAAPAAPPSRPTPAARLAAAAAAADPRRVTILLALPLVALLLPLFVLPFFGGRRRA